MSLVGALGPLGKVASKRTLFASHFLVYLIAGGVASATLGAVLAASGRNLADAPRPLMTFVAIAVVMLALTREAGWAALPLPQLHRQTDGRWSSNSFISTLLWGLDLGLVFTTWQTFAGAWALAAIAFASGDLLFGVTLFLCFWLGRAASVWLAPIALAESRDVPLLVEAIFSERASFKRTHAMGLASALVASCFWLRQLLGVL